jgi:hypothetical protein
MPACSRKGCVNAALFQPIVVLSVNGGQTLQRVRLRVRVCDLHREELRRIFASDDGRRLVTSALGAGHEWRPEWTLHVYFESLH